MQHKLIANFSNLTQGEKYILAQKLGTSKGFYLYYFEQLKHFQNQTKCFNTINLLHHKIFGEYKYTDYDSFRNVLKYQLKKNRK